MDYKEKYKEALERARMINNGEDVDIEFGTTICEYIFPELAESEDEKIRKALIELVKFAKGNCLAILDKPFNVVSMDTMLAWLEKQSKKGGEE